MKTYLTIERQITLAILAMVLVVFGCFFVARAVGDDEFVRGKYGAKCYIRGTEHANIKYPIYFDTLDDCLKSLQEN